MVDRLESAAALVANALSMAIANRDPQSGGIIHSDHGVQLTSWAFTDSAKRSGLVPSMGSIGQCYDNAMIESFWGRMRTELLNRKRWKSRVELGNAIFDYLEIFQNRQRRHSALGMRTPIEFELLRHPPNPWPETRYSDTAEPGAHHLRPVDARTARPESGDGPNNRSDAGKRESVRSECDFGAT